MGVKIISEIMLMVMFATATLFGGNFSSTGTKTAHISCAAQNFEVECLPEYVNYWDEEDGLYIQTEYEEGIPYVLLYRYMDVNVSAETYLTEAITNQMTEGYGSDLVSIGDLTYYTFGDESLPGIEFVYMVGEYSVHSLRVCKTLGMDVMGFNAKYLEGYGEATLEALDLAVRTFKATDISETPQPTPQPENPQPETVPQPMPQPVPQGDITITPNEAANIRFVPYTEPNGYFTAQIPEGWVVEIGLPNNGGVDLVAYGITIYDPTHPERKLHYNLSYFGILKSEEARQWYQTYYPDGPFTTAPFITEPTVAGLFAGMSGEYGYSDFTVKQSLGNTLLGTELLKVGYLDHASGRQTEALVTGSLFDMPYMALQNPANIYSGMIDVGYYTAFTIIIESAGEGELIEWQPVLEQCFASIQFSERFQTERAALWKSIIDTGYELAKSGSEISDMISSTWENSNRSTDIISQKQSDATLGYERVLDTETGEYYKAELGFGDWYTGTRYQVVTDDAAYLSSSSGYINWK